MVGGGATATGGQSLARRLRPIGGRARDRPRIITLVFSVSLGLLAAAAFLTDMGYLTARFGPASTWIYFAVAVPQGWAVGVMAYILLTPGVLGMAGREAVAEGPTASSVPGPASRSVVIGRWLLWSTLPVLLVQQIPNLIYFHRLDTLKISAWLALLIGLELAGRTPAKLDKTLTRLRDREVLIPAQVVDCLKGDIRLRPWRRCWVITGLCVAAAVLVTSPWLWGGASVWRFRALGPDISDAVFLVVGGAAAGSWLGRMVSYGRLLTKAGLRKHQLELQVIPNHPDRAGGLKPLGDFYLYQSLTASLPAIFLAAWVLLISLGGPSPLWGGYGSYLHGYLGLLVAAILFEILVFILPMLSIHDVMSSQKESSFLVDADRLFTPKLARRIGQNDQDDGAQQDAEPDRFGRYKELEEAPTWPVDSAIRRQFTLRNLGFLIPFIGYIVGHMQFWQQLGITFKGLGQP